MAVGGSRGHAAAPEEQGSPVRVGDHRLVPRVATVSGCRRVRHDLFLRTRRIRGQHLVAPTGRSWTTISAPPRPEPLASSEVHKVLYREAAQITLRRGHLDDQYNFLANTSYVTFPLQFIPRYGEAMKLAVEIAALQTALGESYYQMNQVQSEVAQNAAELQQAVGQYSGVAGGAELPGAAVAFDPPLPPPGGGAVAGMTPTERPQQSAIPGGIARPSGVSGGIDAPPGGVPDPMMTPDQTIGPEPLPMVPGLPPLPQVPPLGQLAATSGQRHAKKARPRDDEPADDKDKADDVKDPTKATSDDGESERAPVHADRDPKPDRLQASGAARLCSENPPGPPPQDRT